MKRKVRHEMTAYALHAGASTKVYTQKGPNYLTILITEPFATKSQSRIDSLREKSIKMLHNRKY